MGKGRPTKYNRVTCQQKFMLRRLINKENMSVKQAAEELGINYSTAKTIMFCYKQNISPSKSLLQNICHQAAEATACYIEGAKPSTIQIVSSIGGGQWMKAETLYHESTDQHKVIQN